MTMRDESNAIAITGLGIVSTLGNDVPTFWRNLCAGVVGFARQPALETKGTPFCVGGVIHELPQGLHDATRGASYDRATQLALHAAAQAIEDAGIRSERGFGTVAVVMGTTCGANDVVELPGFDENWFAGHPERCPAESFLRYDHVQIANAISRHFEFDGPSYVVGTACASGNHAIGEAVHLLQEGAADVVVCGGADAFTLLPTLGFHAMKSLASEKCTPFDRHREGMILGEGAAVLVLQRSRDAKARGARVRAEINHWALNCDAANFAAPLASGERCEQLILSCLRGAGLEPGDIDYINVHGTGTKTNDLMEARGISAVYGEARRSVMISSIKGALGHTLGAAGAIEGLVATLAIETGRVPPNTSVSELDEGVDLNIVTSAVDRPLRRVLSLSFAFGGCNVATLFSTPGRGGDA